MRIIETLVPILWRYVLCPLLLITRSVTADGQTRSSPIDTAIIERVATTDETPGFEWRYRLKDPADQALGIFIFHDGSDSLIALEVIHRGDSAIYSEYWPSGHLKRAYIEIANRRSSRRYDLSRISSYCDNGVLRQTYDWMLPLQFVRTYYCNGNMRSRFVQVHDPSNPTGVVGLYEFWYPNGQKQYEEEYDERGAPTGYRKRWTEAGRPIDP